MTSPGLFDAPTPEREVLGVRELNVSAGRLLERTYGTVRVRGELAGVTRAASGHRYFSLQDDGAQLRCAFFRGAAERCRLALENGLEVIATGRLGIYPVRGDYQLIVDRVELSGEGARAKVLEALKVKLRDEGLLDPARKRRLPTFPSVVGVVTSLHGAAIRDIVRVLDTRWPGLDVVVTPVPVQGEGAAREIAAAIDLHVRHSRADVLIVGRGGGSTDDLWAFNEEPVARAITRSTIPVISAVGHESDVVVADLVADVRAATPSQAAELAVRERVAVADHLADRSLRLRRAWRQSVARRRERVDRYAHSHGLFRPRTVLQHVTQRLDDLSLRLGEARAAAMPERRALVERTARRLLLAATGDLRDARAAVTLRGERLVTGSARDRRERRARVDAAASALRALDPARVLERGYSICTDDAGRAVTDGGELWPKDFVRLRFHRGGAEGTIVRAWSAPPNERGDDGEGETPVER